MNLSKSVTNLILKGGQIVHTESHRCTTILIRMPKGEFIQDTRNGQEDNFFEFIYCQNFIDKNVIDVAGWKNGSLSNVRKRTIEEHEEFSHSVWRKNRK